MCLEQFLSYPGKDVASHLQQPLLLVPQGLLESRVRLDQAGWGSVFGCSRRNGSCLGFSKEWRGSSKDQLFRVEICDGLSSLKYQSQKNGTSCLVSLILDTSSRAHKFTRKSRFGWLVETTTKYTILASSRTGHGESKASQMISASDICINLILLMASWRVKTIPTSDDGDCHCDAGGDSDGYRNGDVDVDGNGDGWRLMAMVNTMITIY